MTDTTQPPAETRDRLTHDEQMQDAQKGCVPCALCGGHGIINDAGSGAGYSIRCSNSQIFKPSEGCLIEQRRLGGWAYNVTDWWNRLHTAALTRRAGGDAIPAREASEALRALERFVGDHSGNDDTTDGMEVDRRAQEALSTLRGVLAPADCTVIPAEDVACRFDGIPYSSADLDLAQRAACAIVPLYGTGDHGEQEAARLGKLWNDHPAVQGALRTLHEARSINTPVREGGRFTGEQAWDELVNVDDRTSPEEYPDMCLITRDELIDFMNRAALSEGRSHG